MLWINRRLNTFFGSKFDLDVYIRFVIIVKNSGLINI